MLSADVALFPRFFPVETDAHRMRDMFDRAPGNAWKIGRIDRMGETIEENEICARDRNESVLAPQRHPGDVAAHRKEVAKHVVRKLQNALFEIHGKRDLVGTRRIEKGNVAGRQSHLPAVLGDRANTSVLNPSKANCLRAGVR